MLPLHCDIIRDSRRRLAARRAQLPARKQHSHRISPAACSVSPPGSGCNSAAESCPRSPRHLTCSRSAVEIGLSVMLRGVASWRSFMEASRSGRGTWRRRRTRSPNGACSNWPNSTTPRVVHRATHARQRRAQRPRRCSSRVPERLEPQSLPSLGSGAALARRSYSSASAVSRPITPPDR